MEENRNFPRLISKKDITVRLDFINGRSLEGKIYDISKNGISIIFNDQISDIQKGMTCKLKILQPDQMIKELDAEVKWKCDNKKRIGLEIEKGSKNSNDNSQYDSLIGIISDQKLIAQLAQDDRKIVLKEANIIKVCSSNYFMWTIGALIPLIATIWTLFIQKKISPSSCSGVMLGMFVLYCMSFFSLIEKARAINKREGFIAALDYLLITDNLPQNYPGWIQLKHALAECDSKRSLNQCAIIKDSSCKNKAMNFSSISTSKKLLPSILDSFISLTLLFYGFLYIIILLLSLIALSQMFNEEPFKITYVQTFAFFAAGYLMGILSGKKLISIIFAIAFPIIVIFTHSLNFYHMHIEFISKIYLVFVILPIGFFYGSVLNRIICQFVKLRKREYSFESFFHIWYNILRYCSFMPDSPTDPKSSQSFAKIFQKLCDNI